jgi:hypothetical protein
MMSLTLWIKADRALLKLMKWRVICSIDPNELFLQSLKLALTLWPSCGRPSGCLDQSLQFLVELIQVVLSALNVLLGLQ